MNSARKDGRSFGKARTFTEETEAIPTAIPSSTRYKNKWAVEVFKEWQYYRATKGETSSEVDDNVQTVDTLFQEMNGESMAYWLGKFVQEVVRRDGQKYPPRSLYGIVAGLKRYLDEKSGSLALNPLDKSDRGFLRFQKLLESMELVWLIS
ncbi:Hypothetical predicted protein [Paramuricea clavata]|uniref:QRICH1-like domain-containing protein n=1 Tax=Paramuricea clavata TaxID=317549 RepID=A0A6S7IPW8_PARCT|nr:Hypothetical predicted protein [Paramuricea clavata]